MTKPTIYTIAKAAGVSTATVSKVINNKGSISPETAARVRELIKECNFVPQQRKQDGNGIGVVTFLSDHKPLASPFNAALLNGICGEAFAAGRDITLVDGDRIAGFSPDELHCFYNANSLSGLLGVNLSGSDPFCQRIRDARLPFILLANADAAHGNFVSTRNYEAVLEMLDYLICMGHRTIAYLGLLSAQLDSHSQRLKAYRDMMARHGLPVHEELVVDLPNAAQATIKNAVSRLLARSNSPTALFFASEELTPVFPILTQMGVSIPGDLSLAGMAIASTDPIGALELSAIIQPVEELGRQGVCGLLRLLESGEKCEMLLDNHIRYGETIKKLN